MLGRFGCVGARWGGAPATGRIAIGAARRHAARRAIGSAGTMSSKAWSMAALPALQSP